jgi:hypothetical protein
MGHGIAGLNSLPMKFNGGVPFDHVFPWPTQGFGPSDAKAFIDNGLFA